MSEAGPQPEQGRERGAEHRPEQRPEQRPDHRPGLTTFLERSVYRRRRVIDAIKLLPALGACVFLLPPLILGDQVGSTALRLVYFFFMWLVLIMLCAVLVRALPSEADD